MTLQVEGTAVSLAGHAHSGADVTSGTVADARIASTLARDSEILSIVLANDGPSSGLDADLLDGVQGASYQRRVTGACPTGQSVQAVNADGTIVCYEVPVPPRVTTVDNPANDVGQFTSIVPGADGFPVISYFDATAGALKVAKCKNANCSY